MMVPTHTYPCIINMLCFDYSIQQLKTTLLDICQWHAICFSLQVSRWVMLTQLCLSLKAMEWLNWLLQSQYQIHQGLLTAVFPFTCLWTRSIGQQQVSVCSQDRICYSLSTCIEFLSVPVRAQSSQESRHVLCQGTSYPQLFATCGSLHCTLCLSYCF